MTDGPDRPRGPFPRADHPTRELRRAAALEAGRSFPAGPARSPSPAERAVALQVEAKAATARALETGRPWDAARALAVRSEARVAGAVAGWQRPSIDGDAGPKAPGRGALEVGRVGVMVYDPKTDSQQPSETVVARRSAPRVLAQLPADERATAERFQALMEGVGAIRCIDMAVAGGSNRKSDGGAAARWDADRWRAEAVRAIGDGVALRPRYLAHMDRGQVPVKDAAIVEGLLLRGQTVDAVLAWHGWSRRPEHRRAVVAALSAALRRIMQVLG